MAYVSVSVPIMHPESHANPSDYQPAAILGHSEEKMRAFQRLIKYLQIPYHFRGIPYHCKINQKVVNTTQIPVNVEH